jgi:hypothetical protein
MEKFGSGILDPYIGFSLVSVWQSLVCFTCLFDLLVRRLAGRVGELWLDAGAGSIWMVPVVLQVRSFAVMEFLNGIFSRDFWV